MPTFLFSLWLKWKSVSLFSSLIKALMSNVFVCLLENCPLIPHFVYFLLSCKCQRAQKSLPLEISWISIHFPNGKGRKCHCFTLVWFSLLHLSLHLFETHTMNSPIKEWSLLSPGFTGTDFIFTVVFMGNFTFTWICQLRLSPSLHSVFLTYSVSSHSPQPHWCHLVAWCIQTSLLHSVFIGS